MKIYTGLWMALVMMLSILASPMVVAHGNDDHEHSAPMAANAAIAPRAVAQSEEFELVAVLQAKHLVIYLDRFDSNLAVAGAVIELESQGKWKAIAKENEPGVYVVDLAKGVMETAGKYPLTFTVQTEESADVLAASLEIADEEEAHDHAGNEVAWWKWLVAVASGFGLMLAILFVLRRRSSAVRVNHVNTLTGGAK